MNKYEQYLSKQPAPDKLPIGTKLRFPTAVCGWPITSHHDGYYVVDGNMRVGLDLQCLCGCDLFMEVVE